MKSKNGGLGALLGIVIALGILAVMHQQHLWTMLGARYN